MTLKFSLGHLAEALMGCMWIGFMWLFAMFFYQYNFVYYKKAITEDNKIYKSDYQQMQKISRKIALLFLFYMIITLCLLCHDEHVFLTAVFKGLMVAGIVIPIMNNHYGDKSKFKFSL